MVGEPDYLYHYCSNEAFVSIVQSGSIHLTELSLSNDYMEGKWMRHAFEIACGDMKLSPGDTDGLLQRIDSFSEKFAAAGYCLSEDGDVLSQWRGYSDDGCGVSIGFSADRLVASTENAPLSPKLYPIIYRRKEQTAFLAPIITRLMEYVEKGALNATHGYLGNPAATGEEADIDEAHRELLKYILTIVPSFYVLKNTAFEEEHEWRLMTSFARWRFRESHEFDFKARNAGIVPYINAIFKSDEPHPFADIVIGPRNSTPIDVVEKMMENIGYPDVSVRKSKASYR